MRTVALLIAAAACAAVGVNANACEGCWGATAGPCQHINDGSCMGYQMGYTCFPGTVSCPRCEACTHGTNGPCVHDNDGTCFGYQSGTTCPAGTTRCATGEKSKKKSARRMQSGSGGGSTETEHVCGNCAVGSAGPCRHDNDASCFPYVAGSTDCPVGTSPCVPCLECAAGTSGPCKHNNDGTCQGYLYGTTCAAGTTQCATGEDGGGTSAGTPPTTPPTNSFVPPTTPNYCTGCVGGTSGPCAHDNDGTCFSYIADTTNCPAGTHACPMCSGCTAGTDGPCQHQNDGTCFAYQSGTTCPAGTTRCATAEVSNVPPTSGRRLQSSGFTCGVCFGTSTGPCRHNADTSCTAYTPGTTDCPAGTTQCVACSDCVGDTAGPCKHDNDGTCLGYAHGTTCPAGSTQCATGETGVGTGGPGSSSGNGGGTTTTDPMPNTCLNCWGATTGPCKHNADGSCMNFFPGTTTCPPGSTACVLCSECVGATGPCQHNNDNTCMGYQLGTTCPAGTTRCATGEQVGVTSGRRLQSNDPTYSCSLCVGGTSGPCRHNNDGTCVPYTGNTKTCPAGTTACAPCEVCAAGTSGPCKHNNDGTCLPYTFGTTCPAGTTQCATGESGGGSSGGTVTYPPATATCGACVGGTSGPCRHNNDGTCVAYADVLDPPACPAGTTPCDTCSGCVGGTSGACQHINDGTCMSKINNVCPAGTRDCSNAVGSLSISSIGTGTCGDCYKSSFGPCRHDASDVCHAYYTGTTMCPSGTRECVPCNDCTKGTSGPCKHDKDGSCFGYEYGTVCTPGSTRCADGKKGGGSGGSGGTGGGTGSGSGSGSGSGAKVCDGCFPGTSGACQNKANTVCYSYFPGTSTCAPGTEDCTKTGSAEAEPTVVLDVTLLGADEATDAELQTAIAGAAGPTVQSGDVVIEVTTKVGSDSRSRRLSESGLAVGAVVVVRRDTGANAEEVAANLENEAATGGLTTKLANAGVAGVTGVQANGVTASSPSMRVERPSAPSAGLSQLAIGLIAAGTVVFVAAVVGGVVLMRRTPTETASAGKKVTPSPTTGDVTDKTTLVDAGMGSSQ